MEDIIKSPVEKPANKKKLILTIVILAIIIVAGVIFGLRFLSGEDNWICENGKWIKHGNPSASMPTTPCSKTAVSTGQPIKPAENPARQDPLDQKLGYGCGGPGTFKSETTKQPDAIWQIKTDGSETKVSLGKYKMPLPERTVIDVNKVWLYFSSNALSKREDGWFGLESSYVSGMTLSINGYEEGIKLGGDEYMFMELTGYPLGDFYPYVQERYVEFEIFVTLKCKNIQNGKCLDNASKPLDYVNNADIKSNIKLFATGCEPFSVDISADAKIEYK
jgi:hypothetical protein